MAPSKYRTAGVGMLLVSLSVPILSGCTGATSDSSVASLPAETNTSSPEPSEGSASGEASPSSGSTGQHRQLEVIDDPCASSCIKGGTIEVQHPAFGPMTVIPYWNKRADDNGSPAGNAAYALYQHDKAVGYVEDPNQKLLWFGARPVDQANSDVWNLENGSNVDKYGNVYLSYNGGVTVLTPTDQGYNSYDSMPSGTNPFKNASLHIDPSGEPTMTYSEDGQEREHHWDGNQFVDSEDF
ncbi:hypothetical protein [Rothia uropygioeca]|uniref:hypothetical protein n=2 Tax=unclassified Kocuria TaxID=2649579 RepID=UPI0010133430|nr:hypothetical protein [Kocuria sp. 257]